MPPQYYSTLARSMFAEKEATKRAASEALAQMLAVTAMLVIASIIFYWR